MLRETHLLNLWDESGHDPGAPGRRTVRRWGDGIGSRDEAIPWAACARALALGFAEHATVGSKEKGADGLRNTIEENGSRKQGLLARQCVRSVGTIFEGSSLFAILCVRAKAWKQSCATPSFITFKQELLA